jgi:hypothetical protein
MVPGFIENHGKALDFNANKLSTSDKHEAGYE